MNQDTALKVMKSGANVFLTGKAGSGKSHTIRQFLEYHRQKETNVAITASSGIAATVVGGSTIHSYIGMGIKSRISNADLMDIRKRRGMTAKLKALEVLIIDEISMLHKDQLSSVDFILRSLRRDPRPFGGVQIIVVGDFNQLPPVGPEDINARLCFMSSAWVSAEFKICYLTTTYRQENGELLEILNAIREGTITQEHKNKIINTVDNDLDDLPSQLYTHNASVDYINERELNLIEGKARIYKAITSGSEANVKFLCENVLSPPVLTLKVGAKVLFTKNDPQGNFVNGTLGIVTRLDGGLRVRLSSGLSIDVGRMLWEKVDDQGNVVASYHQVPLKLAWALTVNKSQGLTLESAEIDLSKAFEPGQGYVALSRVSSLEKLRVIGINDLAFTLYPITRKADKRFRELSEEVEKEYG
ncbi:helicase [Acinetobacter phage vB_AbaM_ME3]|uniref:Helicase n=1 Tax=Acinetobacter phage vB_AbaM_ME3 TaxID=1837876 RepID=A0A172Q090_9CAUD|nr:helicase [Acinetobacter phage vB_AbaM_ME3]AND75280.1 helicase [Acinetobacter phage vB_AbaM_ME3]